jgi:hypothetical protein
MAPATEQGEAALIEYGATLVTPTTHHNLLAIFINAILGLQDPLLYTTTTPHSLRLRHARARIYIHGHSLLYIYIYICSDTA